MNITLNGTTFKTEETYQGPVLVNQPCGCYACDNGVEPGHPYCEQPTEELLALEEQGKVGRGLSDSRWEWFVL